MPLLVCPNDNASMQSATRSGVEFDFCPTCRGIWLDRGELEKLLAIAREEAGEAAAAPAMQTPQAPPSREWRDDDRRDRRMDHGYGGHGGKYGRRHDDDERHGYRKRRGLGIFDIFD